jgi:hypothetical protein
MLNARLYRVAFVPFLLALAVASFALGARPPALTSSLAPDAFEGARAYGELHDLAARYPDRRPGSAGDEELADRVAQVFRALGGTAAGGFSVRTERFQAQTIDGEQTLMNVVAERPGSSSESPILILAHRDAAARGSVAELSGTAALLELARVLAARETKRTVVLASTSGGSGGDAGATHLLASIGTGLDAAIVLGDVAGAKVNRPAVVPYSNGYGSAPLALALTLSDMLANQAQFQAGSPSLFGQLAHLAFPLTVGEQGVIDRAGVPAVLLQVSGELGPAPTTAVSAERMEAFGRVALSAVDALDSAPNVSHAMQHGLVLGRKTVPAWAIALLVLTGLLPVLAVLLDGLAGARRRRLNVGRWVLWTLSCALPFFTCALFAYLLGVLGIVGAAPPVPTLITALPFSGDAVPAVVAVVLTFALSWMLWAVLVKRLGWGVRPDAAVAGLALLLLALAVTALAWLRNPYAALLALPALHLWLLLASPELRPRRTVCGGLVALGLLPLLALGVFYADRLGMGVDGLAWMALLLLAGGHMGFVSAAMWSVAFGCGAAAVLLSFSHHEVAPALGGDGRSEVTIRGPRSYAGPGSLGGTASALRR